MGKVAQLPAQAYVYVIGAADGPQKIGIASDPARRVAMLQTGNPISLAIHTSIPASRDMAREIERYAHWLLRAQHVRGEWFDATPEQAAAATNEAATAVQSGLCVPKAAGEPALGQSPMNGRQIKAARMLLSWSQTDLCREAGVSRPTLNDLENDSGDPRRSSITKVEEAFERHGITFLAPGDTRTGGFGVRFRDP